MSRELITIDSNVPGMAEKIARYMTPDVLRWSTGTEKSSLDALDIYGIFYDTPIAYALTVMPKINENLCSRGMKFYSIIYSDYTRHVDELQRIKANLLVLGNTSCSRVIEFTELPDYMKNGDLYGDYFVRRNNQSDANVAAVVARVIDDAILHNMTWFSANSLLSGSYSNLLTQTDNELSVKRFLEIPRATPKIDYYSKSMSDTSRRIIDSCLSRNIPFKTCYKSASQFDDDGGSSSGSSSSSSFSSSDDETPEVACSTIKCSTRKK